MPYGISQEQTDCANWATVKRESDGSYTTIGCHESKQDAIDQMVVVSMSEDIEPLGEIRAEGDMVETEPVVESEPEAETDDESDLTPRQSLMYETYEQIAEQYGMWSQDTGADGAHYVAESPFAAEGLVCANCVFYEGGRKCEVVSGDINPAGICKLWVIAERLITTETEPAESPEVAEIRCADAQLPTMIEPMKDQAVAIEHRWCVTGSDERRVAFSTLEMREVGEGNQLIGYAAVFDSPSEPMPFTEFVKRGAFTKTIKDGADVRLLIDHEGVPLARTKSGTLTLTEDDRGLRVVADLDPANPDAARVMSAMRRGDLSQMSFAFRTIKDAWSDDRSVRELREVQLFDVSVVTFPAYEQTMAELRNAEMSVTMTSTTDVSVRKAQIALARHR
jgi:HK97 family phage prohead protease